VRSIWLSAVRINDGIATTRLVKDGDLSVFRKLDQLEAIVLTGVELDGTGISNLRNLKNLKSLLVESETPISEKGMEEFGKLTQLEVLELSGEITDDKVAYLKNLTNLKEIQFPECTVSPAAMKKLRVALPRTTVLPSY
jgi:hypothetical protein